MAPSNLACSNRFEDWRIRPSWQQCRERPRAEVPLPVSPHCIGRPADRYAFRPFVEHRCLKRPLPIARRVACDMKGVALMRRMLVTRQRNPSTKVRREWGGQVLWRGPRDRCSPVPCGVVCAREATHHRNH
jgi:hypothetical protein